MPRLHLRPSPLPVLLALVMAIGANPANAQRGWGGPGGDFGGSWDHGPYRGGPSNRQDPREGRMSSEGFAADGAAAVLGFGHIAITTVPGGTEDGRNQATFEAAIIDQLAKSGYDTATADPAGGQITELRVTRNVLVPEEAKRNPVSGEMSMGVSNHGSMMGLGIAVDLTKPKKALISTRMELRILDRGNGKPLWEGRADIATREEDPHWSEQAIATRLAAALFTHFPARPPLAAR